MPTNRAQPKQQYNNNTGYGEINYRDRAMIVTILMAVVVVLRLIQIISSLAAYRSRLSKVPSVYVTRDGHSYRNYSLGDGPSGAPVGPLRVGSPGGAGAALSARRSDVGYVTHI